MAAQTLAPSVTYLWTKAHIYLLRIIKNKWIADSQYLFFPLTPLPPTHLSTLHPFPFTFLFNQFTSTRHPFLHPSPSLSLFHHLPVTSQSRWLFTRAARYLASPTTSMAVWASWLPCQVQVPPSSSTTPSCPTLGPTSAWSTTSQTEGGATSVSLGSPCWVNYRTSPQNISFFNVLKNKTSAGIFKFIFRVSLFETCSLWPLTWRTSFPSNCRALKTDTQQHFQCSNHEKF